MASSLHHRNSVDNIRPQLSTPRLPRPMIGQDCLMDKFVVDYVVSDSGSNRYPLICKFCRTHNGMVTKEELEYGPLRCCFCSNLLSPMIEMSNLRTPGFPPPPPGYCSNMQGALHASTMGHHSDTSGMASVAATGASLFSHHLTSGSLHHPANLMSGHNHVSSGPGPFGILPHEAVSLMNSSNGHHSHHPVVSASAMSSHGISSSGHQTNKSCSVENSKHHHHHHHHKSISNASSVRAAANSFGMMPMSQSVHPSVSRNNNLAFDSQFSKRLAHSHHPHQTDSYFGNFLMPQDNHYASQYAAAAANMRVASNQHMLGLSNSTAPGISSRSTTHTQYPSMNFSAPLTRDFIGVPPGGNTFFPFNPQDGPRLQSSVVKHHQSLITNHNNSTGHHTSGNSVDSNSSSSSSFHQQARSNSTLTSNNNLSSCSMMMPTLSTNNYPSTPSLPNASVIGNNSVPQASNNHGSTSRSSSAASNHASLQQGSESSSCSYGYNSPPANLPHSPYQKRNSLSSISSSAVSSQTLTAPSNSSANSNSVQDFNGSGYATQGNYRINEKSQY